MTQHQEHEPTYFEKAKDFYEQYQNVLIGLGVVIILAVAFLFYRNYQTAQQEKAAAPLMDYAQEYYRIDSFNLALYGDGANPGFLEIIDDYGRSSAANLSHFYAGVSFYQLGNISEAITYLEDFETGSEFLQARKYELLGHAYSEQDESDKAARFYKKAANEVDHDFFTPYYLQLAGDYYVYLEQYEDAQSMYERIDEEYPQSSQGREIDRFLKMVEAKLQNS